MIDTKIYTVFAVLTPEPHSKPVYFGVTSCKVTKRLHDMVNGAKNPKTPKQYNQKLSVWLRMMIEQDQVCGYKTYGEFATEAEAKTYQMELVKSHDELLMTRIAKPVIKQVLSE